MSAAAAGTKQRSTHKLNVEVRKDALRKLRAKRRQRGHEIFNQLADADGILRETRLDEFLSLVMRVPVSKLEPNAKQLVMDTARQSKTKGGFAKEPMLEAMEKYGEYLKHAKMVDETYKKFDADNNGVLDKREFRNALEDYEKRANRVVNGLNITLFVTDADLDSILERADVDGDEHISRNEMLPALAAWEELAAVKLEKHAAGCCLIL